ncbi:MAG: 3-oxoacyl-ACP reductase FabG [Firmicutes bacterium]|nr:3-oxoacyl-ACP reductase FabG [Bacillota bacterium]
MARTVLITGSSRGIGRQIALEFAKSGGYNLVINYKENEQAAKEVLNEASKFCSCIMIRADVSKKEQVDELYNDAFKKFGFIDTIINNAGVAMSGLMMDMSENDYSYIMDTNLKGSFFVARAFLPSMIKHRFGRVINISSILGNVGASCEVIYSASKAGIIGLTKALAKEVGGYGIRVNAIAPGLIYTDMTKHLDIKNLEDNIVVGKIGECTDIAMAALFLASDKAQYINGQVLSVDGGLLI